MRKSWMRWNGWQAVVLPALPHSWQGIPYVAVAGGTASHRNVTTQLFPVPPTNDGALVPDVNNIVEVEGLLFEKCH